MEAKEFRALRVSLASPEQIRSWSYGEVTKPETINYRRLRPEKDGLFCEAIFGPTRDWQCYCGKFKNVRYRGVICDKCGVEVTRAAVRRERMGHIELAAPVAHVWYTRRVPSYLGMLLDVGRRNLDRVLYFAQYVVTNIDEEARRKALARIDRELQSKETNLGSDLEGQMGDLRTQRDQVMTEYEVQARDLKVHFEREFERMMEEMMGEARRVQGRIESLIGQPAPSDIDFPSANTIVVAKGETVDSAHITRIQNLVQNRIGQIQTEIDALHQTQIKEMNVEADRLVAVSTTQIDQHMTDLNERVAGIRAQAERARAELADLEVLQFLAEPRYRELKQRYHNVFQADMGAEAFYEILKNIDLEKMSVELWKEVRTTRSKQRKKKATKRLGVVESLRKSSNRPEWMILTVLPVIPPDLRPMVQLDGGRFATSDLNDLYRRVINRNNRLKHLLDLGAPDVIVRNEKRMLQEAVDSLIDNSQRGKALSRRGRRELKSLSDMLKGKKGRFRRNLLGKRVDYSGRSVIVIGPRLKLDQCGLPKTMALELYRPFVISRLVKQNYASNVKGAKRVIEREKPEVWEALEQVIKERPVLLNRAPTLHRLGIQAFEPQLVEGKAIQIHPLVCAAFNADFDGDQMAVHVPLSDKAVQEARELMLSTKNLLKPADGQPIVGPAKDMVLGIYYLTMDPTVEVWTKPERADEFRRRESMMAADIRVGIPARTTGYFWSLDYQIPGLIVLDDVVETDEQGKKKITQNATDRTIQAVLDGEVDCMIANTYDTRKLLKKQKRGDALVPANLTERQMVVDIDEVEYLVNMGMIELHTPILLGNYYDDPTRTPEAPETTTAGRALFNRILPDDMRFVQDTLGKKQLQDLVAKAYQKYGSEKTTDIVDAIKDRGFYYATVSGTTMAVTDLTIPEERAEVLAEAEGIVERAEKDFRRGLLTEEERYQRTIDVWTKTKDTLQDMIKSVMNPYGPIAVMALSGSTKGGFGPITQLAGMRGLMADPSGRIIDLPIRSHFREGLTALEYFISTHGARKGLADTALRTADAGYLTRRLVDVAQDMIINRTDCGTASGIWIRRSDDIAGQKIYERIIGRCSAQDIYDPETGELIVARNGMIDEEVAETIQASKLAEVYMRSPMACALIHGCCALCYGRDLGRGDMVEIGTAVGIIAAQSIGEPGTQLTLRTFHTGGTAQASGDITSGLPRVEEIFEGRKKPKGEAVITDIGGTVRLTKREDGVRIATIIESEVQSEENPITTGWTIKIEDGQKVEAGTILAIDEDNGEKIVAKMQGTIFLDIEEVPGTPVPRRTIYIRYETRQEAVYELPSSSRLAENVFEGCEVYPGQQLTEGSKNPHRILKIMGQEPTALYLLTEVQKVYRNQGVNIADKHFEIIIRKMMSKVQITRSGDSTRLPGELIDKLMLIDMNQKLIDQGKAPAAGVPVLLGVTKAALNTDSFLSASSFQHTIRVLAGAAIEGKLDKLYGLKENVIIGKLIPAGTGFFTYQDRELVAPVTTLEAQGALDAVNDFDDDDDDGIITRSGDRD
ncbi:MAG: DNA-directed RNA polymerase subunit beta' [Chloroflexota bacterium]|nr:DNA-directed RNA polymerase subunit beta' [Chloroflexota bacterium]